MTADELDRMEKQARDEIGTNKETSFEPEDVLRLIAEVRHAWSLWDSARAEAQRLRDALKYAGL